MSIILLLFQHNFIVLFLLSHKTAWLNNFVFVRYVQNVDRVLKFLPLVIASRHLYFDENFSILKLSLQIVLITYLILSQWFRPFTEDTNRTNTKAKVDKQTSPFGDLLFAFLEIL